MGRRTPQKKIRLVWLWIWMIQFAAMLALSLIAAPWEAGRAARIAALCDDYAIVHNSCVKFYRPARVAAAYAALCCGGDSLTQAGFSLPLPLFIAPADRV